VKPLRERDQAAVGAVTLVVLVLAVLAAFYSDDLPIIGGGTTYAAYFSESAGLVSGNEVRVAGVKVGKVSRVSLAHDEIRVDFEVKNTWIGDTSTISIQIKTLLGEKYLAIDAEGTRQQNPHDVIPKSRTLSPFDITDAVNQLANTVDDIDTSQLAQSFEVIANTFKNSAQGMKGTLTGLESLSRTISSRDTELARLLSDTNDVSTTLADRDAQFQKLLSDGNLLLGELQTRRDAVSGLLTGTQALATQLEGLVTDDQATLTPALTDLGKVTDILKRNQANLSRGLADLAPFARLFTNTVGNGRWFDGYFCGLLPPPVLTTVFQSNPQGCSPPIAAPNLNGGGTG
jgi:phospholipid/cholesterol/gamma-HCH transport system substrate-binding protein